MQEPNFEPMKPLHASDPLPSRIAEVMRTDYRNYLQCRSADQKTISMLIGKTIDLNALSVEWGRPATLELEINDRPPVDRSSGLYSSRRSAMAKDASMPTMTKKNRTPVSAKGTPKAAPMSVGEDVLKDDLYLTSSDDDEPTSCTPNVDAKDPKIISQDTNCSRSTSGSSNNSKSKGVKDLSYWMAFTEKLKAPSTSNSGGPGTPEGQKSHRSSSHEPNARDMTIKKEVDEDKESVTPKSIEGVTKYRELVKNELDSLGGQRPARRSNLGRMLSGLNDSDDEGPNEQIINTANENVKPTKRSKFQNGGRNCVRHDTPLSPVPNTYGEWKRRKGRSPVARNTDRQITNCFVDRKISKSPERELVPYNDLDDGSDDSPHPAIAVKQNIVSKPLQTEAHLNIPDYKKNLERRISPTSSPVPNKRRKMEKAAPSSDEDAASKRASKSNGISAKRLKSLKTEPKTEIKTEPFDNLVHGFKHDPKLGKFHISFKVPFDLTSPSHRKRKRRHNRENNPEPSLLTSKTDKVPTLKCPVQSSSTLSSSDSDSRHNRLAETGGFTVTSDVNTDSFDVQSPDTDPMVDPTFDRNLSDDEWNEEVSPAQEVKKSPAQRSHPSHRSRVGHMTSSHSNSRTTSPSKGTSAPRLSSFDHKQQTNDSVCENSIRSASVNASDRKLGHTNSASNLVGQSLPFECKREPDCKKSPDSRLMVRQPSSPSRGDRVHSTPLKTSPVHEPASNSTTIKFEPSQHSTDTLKSNFFNEPAVFKNIKIPRKRPATTRDAETSETKKKRKHSQDQLHTNTDDSHGREVVITKVKESKKKSKIKKQKSEPEPVKREPITSPARGHFEVTVSDFGERGRSFSPNPTDSAAPFLPTTTTEYSEMATQCDIIPVVDRDVTDSGTHTKRMAVAFRIEGGRGSTPIVSAEMRGAQPQTPRSSASGMLTFSSDSQHGGSTGVPRRVSSASNAEDGEVAQSADNDESVEARDGPRRCSQSSNSDEILVDAVIRHRLQQEVLVQHENAAYLRMNSTKCFSEAAAKKHEADRLKNEGPSRFALYALRACYLFIQACYVEERQNKLENSAMHYRETVQYVRSTSNMIEQVTKVPSNSDLLSSQKARVRHNFITLLCAQMKAVLNYRIYWLAHRDTARLRQEVERELSRCGAGIGANGASERSTPESLTRSPAAPGGSGSSGASLHLIGEGHHKLMRYLRQTKSLLAAQEYWQHAILLRAKHGADLKRIEDRVLRRAGFECAGPETPVPCFLRYLNTFLTLHENGEL